MLQNLYIFYVIHCIRVIYQIPTTLHKPHFPSCAILFPRDIYPDESRDVAHTRRTLQL